MGRIKDFVRALWPRPDDKKALQRALDRWDNEGGAPHDDEDEADR